MQAMLQTTSKFCLASILLIPECHENPRPTRIFSQLFGTKTDKGCENSTVAKVLFCSLAVLDPRVGHTMDVLSPFIPVLCHSD